MNKFKNVVNLLSYIPKRFMAILAILVLVTPILTSAGWAPNRPVKDWNTPADRTGFDEPTFNSFINTPNYGDERAFYDGKDATNTTLGGFQDEINVAGDGQQLLLRTYVHNGANQSLNESGEGVAKNTKVRILLPSGTDRALRSLSYITADNAASVSDTVDFVNELPFKLEYVPGSARAYTNAVTSGYQVADSIVTSGAQVGYNGPNGEVPGCFEFDMLVTIKVNVKVADYTIQKQVRKVGETAWAESVTAKAGDEVEFQITFKNGTDTELREVVVGDILPQHLSYVANSTKLKNGNHPNGTNVQSNNITTGGVNIGHYNPGAAAYILFRAKVTGNIEQLRCGNSSLINKAVVQPGQMPSKEDTASVVVTRVCQPPVTPPKVTPSESLPITGPETMAFGLLGSGGLGYAIRNYRRSRKGLKTALLDV